MISNLYDQCLAMIDPDLPTISNISNLLSLLFYEAGSINWIGLYLVDESKKECLLGPFQGKVACTRISFGKGVVGTCCLKQKEIVVEDVHRFPGHIACDSTSLSEFVFPIKKSGKLIAILDVDSPVLNRFLKEDQIFFSSIGNLFSSLFEKSELVEELIKR